MREIKLELAGRLSQNKPLAAFLASDPWRCLPCAPRSLAPADRGDHSTQPMSSPAARNCIRAAPPAQKMGAPGTSPQRSEGRAPGRPQTHQREKRTGTRNGCPILAQCRGPQGQVFVLGVVEQGWEPHPSPSQRHPERPAFAFQEASPAHKMGAPGTSPQRSEGRGIPPPANVIPSERACPSKARLRGESEGSAVAFPETKSQSE